MENDYIELISIFISIGGIGYFNYIILNSLGVLNKQGDKDQKYFFLILFSVFNFLIFEYMSKWVLFLFSGFREYSDFLVSFQIDFVYIVISIALIFIQIYLIYKISPIYYVKINNLRSQNGLSKIDSNPIRSQLFDKDKVIELYIYDLYNDSKPLICGNVISVSEPNEPLEIILLPFVEKDDIRNSIEYSEIIKRKYKSIDSLDKAEEVNIYFENQTNRKNVIIYLP